ncbi:protein phosphatase 2C 7-like [Bidens hawaiensis]|uniref:protein phosphatase 2C 7-like n=1 Tax=Bidens hawaiensis TaxID=980011 RepID=UPI004049806E
MGLIEEVTLTKIALLTGATKLLSDHVPVFLDGSSNDLSIIQEIGSDGLVNDDVMIQENISKEISLPITIAITDIDKGQVEVIGLGKETIESAIGLKASVVVVADKNHSKTVRSVFELEYVPLYGSHSVCGRRAEMEDAVSSVPAFMKIPVKMLVGDRVINGINTNLTDLTAHFFGVYDGHGGCQVANYCRDRVHTALEEEIKVMKQELIKGTTNETVQVQWEKTFTNCFKKVDDEVGGKTSSIINGSDTISEPVAPETVGSTAVVALICSSHIIVANCGDSRAVLYRGKEAIALSSDHKPNREDEYARIEAAGGKVIQWNGHRVFGVLAMSRSIGDGYLKPSIIPEPEVTFTPRARDDECLILASDGLWDVISNQEACEVAKRRILIWHKKYGGLPVERVVGGPDLAAQAAADYLTMLAMQKGSKDDISVIVVDLKSQRKLKAKPG